MYRRSLICTEEARYIQKKLDIYRRSLIYTEEARLYIYIGDAWKMQKAVKTDGNNKTRQTKLNYYKR